MPVIMPSLQGFAKNPDGSYRITEKKAEYGKITGTQMSGLLGRNPWQTPFSTCVRMMRLYNEDISDKPAIHAGVVMEPKILDYIGAVHGDDIFQKREGDHETWASDFQDEIFGGHIDGLMPDGSIVEIKTSSRPKDWDGQIPEHYHIQASLYAHFFKTDSIIFGVAFTDRNTLSNPDAWQPNESNTIVVKTGLIDGFDSMMSDAEKIYRETVLSGYTPIPDMSNPIDAQIVKYLDAQLWDKNAAVKAINHANSVMDMIEMSKLYQEDMDETKLRLSLYMDYNNLSEISEGGITVIRSEYTRSSIDTNALKKDGLYDLYVKEKPYRSLKISRK